MSAPAEARVFEHPAVSRQKLRERLVVVIDRFISMLDDLDGDTDFEDVGDDEPSLSASLPVDAGHGSQEWWLQGSSDDSEDACEDEGAEHDGREPEEDNDTSDYEASLCGVSFGVGSCSTLDAEGTSAAFALDQSQGV
jgi:hypothetical protein